MKGLIEIRLKGACRKNAPFVICSTPYYSRLTKPAILLILILFSSVVTAVGQSRGPGLSDQEQGLLTTLTSSQNIKESFEAIDKNSTLLSDNISDALSERARQEFSAHQFQKSLLLFLALKRIAQLRADKDLLAYALQQIGAAYYSLNQFEKAVEAHMQSKKVREESGDKQGTLQSLINLSYTTMEWGDYKSAKVYANQTYNLAESLSNKKISAYSLFLLGKTLILNGEYQDALRPLERSLTLFTELGDQESICNVLNKIGKVERAFGNYDKAFAAFRKSLELSTAIPDQRFKIRSLTDVALLYADQGDYEAMFDYLSQSLALARELKDRSSIAINLLNMGIYYREEGDIETGQKLLVEALRISKEDKNDRLSISCLGALGAIYLAKGKFGIAEHSFDEALWLSEKLNDQPRRAWLLWRKAKLFFAQGDPANTLKLVEESALIAERIGLVEIHYLDLALKGEVLLKKKEIGLAEKILRIAVEEIEKTYLMNTDELVERPLFFEDKVNTYHLLINALIVQGKLAEALSYAEQAKARTLIDILKNGRSEIAKSMSEQEKGVPERKINRGGLSPFKVEDICSIIPDKSTVVLEYVITEDKTILFVLMKNESRPGSIEVETHTIFIKSDELSKKVKTYRDLLATNDPGFRQTANELYNLLIYPARQQLSGKSNVVIIPDSSLWNLPFQALQNKEGKFLLEEFALSSAPSLQFLTEIKKRVSRLSSNPQKMVRDQTLSVVGPPQGKQFFAMGNPQLKDKFDPKEMRLRNISTEPIPEAEVEVNTIGKEIYGPQASKVYTGASARKNTALAEMGQYKIIHFATHAVLDDKKPLDSYLMLTPGENSQDDGLLRARDLMNLNLKAEMVVLSACDTAMGRTGAEGIIGMTWALFTANVPTIVASQWEVLTDSTTKLMIDFHRHVAAGSADGVKLTKAEAMRRAVLEMIGKDPKLRLKPFYWAGFIVIGAGGK